jgi:hypothetical protein
VLLQCLHPGDHPPRRPQRTVSLPIISSPPASLGTNPVDINHRIPKQERTEKVKLAHERGGVHIVHLEWYEHTHAPPPSALRLHTLLASQSIN